MGVVTKPFLFEGTKRARAAEQGIAELRENVDSLITIPNNRLLTIAPKKAKLSDMLKCADDVLHRLFGVFPTLSPFPASSTWTSPTCARS